MPEPGRPPPTPPPRAIGIFRSIRRQSTNRCGFEEKIDFVKQCLFARKETVLNRCSLRFLVKKRKDAFWI